MRGITQDDVFKVANEIAVTGEMPTREAIYKKLGRGSGTTLHKYLTEWRTMLLKHAGRVQNSDLPLIKENQVLQQNVEQLTNLLTTNSAELTEVENKLQEFKNQMRELSRQLYDLRMEKTALESSMATKDKILESLKDEMRQIHQDSIEAIRQNADRFHEQLMQEKIKVINLEEKLRTQTSSATMAQNKDLSPKKSQINLTSFLDNLNTTEDEY